MAKNIVDRLRRQIQSLPWNAGQPLQFDIPQVQDIELLKVSVAGTLTLTAAGTAVRAEAPAQLINNMVFAAGGTDALDSITGINSVFGNYKRKYSRFVTPPTGFAIGAYNVRARCIINVSNFGGIRPKDTAFGAYNTDLLQLTVNCGQVVDCFLGGATAGTFAGNVTVQASSYQENQKPVSAANPNGANDHNEARRVTKRSTLMLPYAAANSAQEIRLPVGNAIRLLKIHARDNLEPSDGLINSAIFQIGGTDVRVNLPYNEIREMNAADLGIPLSQIPTGYAVLDSSPEGKFSEYWIMRGETLGQLILNMNAPVTSGLIEVEVEEDIY